MTHHSDEHVSQNDDDGDVIEGEEKHPHPLHYGRGVATPRKAVGELVTLVFLRVFDLNAFDAHQSEHGPEQTVEGPRHTIHITCVCSVRSYTCY